MVARSVALCMQEQTIWTLRSRTLSNKVGRAFSPNLTTFTRNRTIIRTMASKSTSLPARLPATYYRGGTSRAVMFNKQDLPADETTWPEIFRTVLGSPDPNGRQLNGMGGGISSLSKVCLVAPSTHTDADVDYTFVQIGVRDDTIDTASNCGNMSAAIGPFAVDVGLATPTSQDETTVRIFNTNTSKIIHSTFAVENGNLNPRGSFSIDGVAGSASQIRLDFLSPAGSKTGKLLPTGQRIQKIDGVDASCIDCGNPVIFIRSQDFDIDPDILPEALEREKDILERLENIRRKAAVLMGMAKSEAETPLAVPKIVMVSGPFDSKLTSGEVLKKEEADLVVRAISSGQPHRAVPVTVSMAVAAAAGLEGTVVESVTQKQRVRKEGIVVAHPTGRMVVGSEWDDSDQESVIKSARIYSTARRLMEGYVYI